ncbi:MAG: hypothetical protein HOP29_18750 [Phycisphaerales bacterium]|nr:hypothetical protein [Phycisphaerales bacterium]
MGAADSGDSGRVKRRSRDGREIRPGPIVGLVAVYALFLWLVPVSIWKPGHVVWPAANVQVTEAEAWVKGSLSLPERGWDTALCDGRVYSHFPPLMTFVSCVVFLCGWEGVPFNLLAILFVLPVPGLAYVLFLRRCPSVFGALVMTCAFVMGTSELLVMCRALQSGKVWQLNHAVSQVGLILLLMDVYGRRRGWLGGVGLIICVWTRYTMAAYAGPLLWSVFAGEDRRRAAKIGAVSAVVLAVGVPMALNALKFGNPLDSGYALIYEGRHDDPTDQFAQDAKKYGVFSTAFLARNLWAMNVGPPNVVERREGKRLEPNTECTGIWWTTPLLLFLFIDRRRIWAERSNRAVLAAVVVVYGALMLFHTTGAEQRGYNRFSLDFLLPLLTMIAPFAFEGKRRYATTAMAASSIWYFVFWVGA